MADAWQSAWVEVLPDFKNFRSKANRELTGILGDAGDSAGNSGSQKFGKSFVGGIGKLALPIAGAFAALGIGNMIADAVSSGLHYAFGGINLASDLSETKSAVDAIFGKDTGAELQKWAGRGAAELGQTQQQALDAAKTFGVFGQMAGLAGGDLFNFSTDLTSLATDFASFYNASPQEAIDAIGAGLRGEAEPLRRFGILMDDASLKAKALEMGLSDGKQPLTQQQKVLAAQALILGNAGAAMGDFEKTSGGLANQQRILAASFEEAQTKLGTALLPGMTTFATFANDTLVPMLNDLIDKVGPVLADAFAKAGPVFADFLAQVGPHLPELIQLGSDALPKILDAISGGVQFVIDFAGGLQNIFDTAKLVSDFLSGDISAETFTAKLHDLAQGFSDPLRAAVDFNLGLGNMLGDAGRNVVNFGRTVGEKIREVVGFFRALPGQVGAFVGNMRTAGVNMIQGFVNGVASMARTLINRVRGVVSDAVEAAKNLLGIASPSRVMAQIGRYTFEGFALGITKEAARTDVSSAFMPNVAGVTGSGVRSASSFYAGGSAASSGLTTGDVNIYTTQPADRAFVSGIRQQQFLLGMG